MDKPTFKTYFNKYQEMSYNDALNNTQLKKFKDKNFTHFSQLEITLWSLEHCSKILLEWTNAMKRNALELYETNNITPASKDYKLKLEIFSHLFKTCSDEIEFNAKRFKLLQKDLQKIIKKGLKNES